MTEQEGNSNIIGVHSATAVPMTEGGVLSLSNGGYFQSVPWGIPKLVPQKKWSTAVPLNECLSRRFCIDTTPKLPTHSARED